MKNPTISIIIPIYNVEKFINRCVDSILNQSYDDLEIILVDDGSPDMSGSICDDYSENDKRIKVIHKENGGLSSARNSGLRIAKGKYIGFIDSDDFYEQNFLLNTTKYLDTKADIIIGSIYWTDATTLKKQPQDPIQTKLIERKDYNYEIPGLVKQRRLNYIHGKLYKADTIFNNSIFFDDDQKTSAEDTVFNFSILQNSLSIMVISDYVANYVVNYPEERLAHKFYPDRFQRSERLHDYMVRICIDLGCYNEALQKVILERRFLSGIWFISSLMQQRIPFGKRYKLLKNVITDNNFLTGYQICKSEFKEKRYKVMVSGKPIKVVIIFKLEKVKFFISRILRIICSMWRIV